MTRPSRNIILSLTRAFLKMLPVVILVPALQGCFTGVESTPRITARDVRSQVPVAGPDDTYLSDIRTQPLSQWKPGKRFYVTDQRVRLLFGAAGSSLAALTGTELSYRGATDVATVTGEPVGELTFVTVQGEPVTYRLERSLKSIGDTGRVDIPFTVDMDVVNSVRERMAGKQYYVTTAQWYDTAGQALTGRKFVRVTVDSVTPGNSFYPVRLHLRDDHGTPFTLLMATGPGARTPRRFSTMLSLDDPRKRYPLITDEVWAHIINGRVADGMTREECRLSLGAPSAVDRRPGYSIMREIWSYENGIYLIFEDGILTSFRK